MNKAFMKEPEAPAPTCPECGALGAPVERETLLAQIGEERAHAFTSDAHFCWNPACPVGYFDAWSKTVPADALASPAYPKSYDAPVCACLDVRADVVVAEARTGTRGTVLRIIGHVRSGEAACRLRSPDGGTCERRVRRLFAENSRPGG